MKISEKTIQFLAKSLCGDIGLVPYKTGPQLVDFFVHLGANDQYGEGFPSRWRYTEEKVREFNDSKTLKEIIELSLGPRDFSGLVSLAKNGLSNGQLIVGIRQLSIRTQ